MSRPLSAACLVLVAITLTGCGKEARTRITSSDSFLGDGCAVEVGFERDATDQQQQRFRRRVESIPGVARVEIISREQVIDLFKNALHEEGYSGEQFDRLAARVERRAGATLIATPRSIAEVPRILTALEELPAAVSSVADRSSCTHG
jgi:cell division protein FtsX